MKLTHILNEGLTFGHREIQLLMKYKNRFTVGIEYEWKLSEIDEHSVRDTEEWRDAYDEAMTNQRNEWLHDAILEEQDRAPDAEDLVDYIMTVAQKCADIYHAYSILTPMVTGSADGAAIDPNAARDALNNILAGATEGYELDHPDIAKTFNDFVIHEVRMNNFPASGMTWDINEEFTDEAEHAFLNLKREADVVLDAFNEDGSDTASLFTTLKKFVDSMGNEFFETATSSTDDFGKVGKTVSENGFATPVHHYVATLQGILEDEAENYIRENADDLIDPDTIDRWMDSATDYADTDSDMLDYGTPEVNTMAQILQNEQMMYDIEDVTGDASLGGEGAEAITKKLQIDEAIAYMHKMFDVIGKHGYTDDDCGMHVNMSFQHSDIKFDAHNLNMVKLLLLLHDKSYMRDLYPIRDWVRSNFYNMNPDRMGEVIARYVIQNGGQDALPSIEELERAVDSTLLYGRKHVGVNILGLSDPRNMGSSRVEFRYMGGKDYHKHGKELEFNIWRYAYILEAAFNPDFGRKEYLKSLYDWINGQVEDAFDMSLDRAIKAMLKLYLDEPNMNATSLAQAFVGHEAESNASAKGQDVSRQAKKAEFNRNNPGMMRDYIHKHLDDFDDAVGEVLTDVYRGVRRIEQKQRQVSERDQMTANRVKFLEAIEEENFQRIPNTIDQPFVKAFIEDVVQVWWDNDGRNTPMFSDPNAVKNEVARYLVDFFLLRLLEKERSLIEKIISTWHTTKL